MGWKRSTTDKLTCFSLFYNIIDGYALWSVGVDIKANFAKDEQEFFCHHTKLQTPLHQPLKNLFIENSASWNSSPIFTFQNLNFLQLLMQKSHSLLSSSWQIWSNLTLWCQKLIETCVTWYFPNQMVTIYIFLEK